MLPKVLSILPIGLVAHASDVAVRPVAADNWFGAQSIQVDTTNVLVGVAAVEPGIAYEDLWAAANWIILIKP